MRTLSIGFIFELMPARRWSQLVDSIINIFEEGIDEDVKDENAACLFHLRVASWSWCCNTEDSGRIDLNLVIAILAELPLAWVFYLEPSLSINIKES